MKRTLAIASLVLNVASLVDTMAIDSPAVVDHEIRVRISDDQVYSSQPLCGQSLSDAVNA